MSDDTLSAEDILSLAAIDLAGRLRMASIPYVATVGVDGSDIRIETDEHQADLDADALEADVTMHLQGYPFEVTEWFEGRQLFVEPYWIGGSDVTSEQLDEYDAFIASNEHGYQGA